MIPWPWKRLSPGARGENAAVRHLRKNGYLILERNHVEGRYEIDILARKADVLVAVEVKSRAGDPQLPPETNVGPEKQRRVAQAAKRYLDRLAEPALYLRFDVIAVTFPETGRLQIVHIEDAYRARG